MATTRTEADACTLLDTDHKAVKKMFKTYEELAGSKARGVAQKKVELAHQICQKLTVHAWVYGLKDGLMHDLGFTVSQPEKVIPRYSQAVGVLAAPRS